MWWVVGFLWFFFFFFFFFFFNSRFSKRSTTYESSFTYMVFLCDNICSIYGKKFEDHRNPQREFYGKLVKYLRNLGIFYRNFRKIKKNIERISNEISKTFVNTKIPCEKEKISSKGLITEKCLEYSLKHALIVHHPCRWSFPLGT